MGALELRTIVLNYIKTADERLLKEVKAVVENYNENEIVSCSLTGDTLTRQQYLQKLMEAEEEIENGQFTTQEDLKKEAEDW